MYDNKPIVTLIDIESSPLMMYAWGAYEQNALKILEPTKIIACAWKTLGENDAVVKTLADYKGYKPGVVDDEKLVRDVWKVLDRSDVVLGHNLDRFDIRKLNTRFAVYNLDAPSYYKTIDTLKVAKKMFAFHGIQTPFFAACKTALVSAWMVATQWPSSIMWPTSAQ